MVPSQKTNFEYLQYIRQNGYAFSFDVDSASPFEYSTLMIMGRQDAAVGYKDALRLMDNYPRGTFAVLDMAGHNLQFERPALYESLVNDWLERVEIFTPISVNSV